MRTYILRRLLYAIPTLLGISVIVFVITRLSPGDPVRLYTFGALDITEADIEALREYYGLNKSLPLQYVDWLGQVVRGDFGMSLTYNRPALPLLLERMPATLQLAFAALLLQLAIGIPLGVTAALRRGSWVDNVIRVFGVIGHAIPTFWIGLLMIIFVSVTLRLLPSQGVLTVGKDMWDIGDRLRHIIMPAFVLALAGIANYSRYLRTETLDVISQDYVRTAHAKGLKNRSVVYVHALRNALIPMVTALGGLLAALVSGALVVEQVFTWPGVGQFTYAAARSKDYPVIMAGVMLASTLLVLSYLLRDIVYAMVDPRIKVR
ncbi:MAG: ABC transporter permease [Candidatus Limnocylindria bacterium]|nr:ABC transporter permease [Chloroflexota bacterium]MDQ3401196.1 ABC transporter permease [Chloroflexota bacterium]